MRVERFIFSINALEAFPNVPRNYGVGLAENLSINVTIGAEDCSALAAFGDGVIGVAIGKFHNGTPAFITIKRRADGSFWHDPPRVMSGDGFASAKRLLPSA